MAVRCGGMNQINLFSLQKICFMILFALIVRTVFNAFNVSNVNIYFINEHYW